MGCFPGSTLSHSGNNRQKTTSPAVGRARIDARLLVAHSILSCSPNPTVALLGLTKPERAGGYLTADSASYQVSFQVFFGLPWDGKKLEGRLE